MLPDESRHPASSFVYFSHATDEEGGMSGAEGFLRLSTLPRSRTSSPLSPSAGEGPGVRAARTQWLRGYRTYPMRHLGF